MPQVTFGHLRNDKGARLGSPFGGAGTALAVTERVPSPPFGHLIHFGMIATGNHGYFDSLRGQLSQRERQGQDDGEDAFDSFCLRRCIRVEGVLQVTFAITAEALSAPTANCQLLTAKC